MKEKAYKGIGISGEGWIYGFLYENENRSWILIPNEQFIAAPQMVEVYPDSVCRFTGIFDSREKPLYENDEITVDNYKTFISFDEGSFYHTAYSDFDYLSHGKIVYIGNTLNQKYGISESFLDKKKFFTRSTERGFVEYNGKDQYSTILSIHSSPLDHAVIGIGTEDKVAYLTESQIIEVIQILSDFVEEGEI